MKGTWQSIKKLANEKFGKTNYFSLARIVYSILFDDSRIRGDSYLS